MASRDEWVGAALAALADLGETGIAVEPLAARLGVTKGSFYWHFRDREELVVALLEMYERVAVDEPIELLAAERDGRMRLTRLLRIAFDRIEHLRAERALFGSTTASVRATLTRVHDKRRRFLAKCYRELGYRRGDADRQAALTYATFVGAVTLAGSPPFDNDRALARFVEHAIATLIPK